VFNRFAHAGRFDQMTSAAIAWLSQRSHGRIEQLSDWIGFSNRQLRRRFSAAVGYGPKMFQSVLRFQRLLHLAGNKNAPRNLARLSADAGYADQAHMTREAPNDFQAARQLCYMNLRGALSNCQIFLRWAVTRTAELVSGLFKVCAGQV
jgi:transcriptional regulator GlxA family with amidase domain